MSQSISLGVDDVTKELSIMVSELSAFHAAAASTLPR